MDSKILSLSNDLETHHWSWNISSLNSHTVFMSQCATTTQEIVRDLQRSIIDTSHALQTMNGGFSNRIGIVNDGMESDGSDYS
jgi:hypothetical protein